MMLAHWLRKNVSSEELENSGLHRKCQSKREQQTTTCLYVMDTVLINATFICFIWLSMIFLPLNMKECINLASFSVLWLH